jgi:sulfatase maturation enzyme AslB (radical SAM superfamily)
LVIKYDFRHKKLDGDLLLTTACPVECDFCVYSCTASRETEKWMPEKTIRRVAEEYSKNDVGIRISGGEPFYDLKKLERCIDILLEYYKPIELLIITSGFFAINEENTKTYIDVISRKKFDTLAVSMDRFHQKKIPLKNVENIIKVCNIMGIEVALRLSLDSLSFPLINKVSELIVKYKLPIESHDWGAVGRAEKLDSSLRDTEKVREYLFSKIKELAEKYNAPQDPRYYLTHTAKRSQREYASEFFPTTFPNGNVYACSMTMKGCYMGNINKENLLDMMNKLKNTFPGHYILSDSDCYSLIKFLPEKFNWRCEFCKDRFFIDVDKSPKEAIGRELIRINSKSNLNILFKQLLDRKKSLPPNGYEREILLSIRLTEKNLNEATGKKIKTFLDKLKINKIRFALSRPLPPCLGKITDNSQPKNCFECRELFTVENGSIKYCDGIKNNKEHRLELVKDRSQIYNYFKTEYDKLKHPEKCKACLFRIRNQCTGICFKK